MARQRADSRIARKEVGDLAIPQDIADSISSFGGVEGLIESLPPDDSIERMQRWYQACADPVRLKILSLLMVRPLCVCVIKACLQMADSKLSYHLNILKRAGMIEGEQQGYYIIYNLTDQARMFLERERERLHVS
ncbi:MAG: hypothetical protein APR55_07380 [Methanolinea sp. SDB]|nr:MAG: hypothetical protein APR55_07380 [Methanolinea sp. SDB]